MKQYKLSTNEGQVLELIGDQYRRCFMAYADEAYKQWLAEGNTPDPVDVETLEQAKIRRSNEVDAACKTYVSGKYDQTSLTALNAYLSSGNETQKALCGQIFTWTQAVMENAVGRQAQVQAATTVAEVDAVSTDYSEFDATKPAISIVDVIMAQNQ